MIEANQMCHRKRRYWTEYEALRKARKCERKRKMPLKVYLCPFCLGWHLAKRGNPPAENPVLGM